MKLIATILLILFSFWTYSQCSVTIQTPNTAVDCGDCFDLTAVGEAQQVLMSENFNNSGLGPGWTSSQTLMYTNPCGAPPDGSPAAWFGNLQAHPRELTTIDYDMSCGGDICFMMKYATQGGSGSCEGPDLPGEGVDFQYSINGGLTWVSIFNHTVLNNGTNAAQTSWNQYCYPIPAAAQTTSTRFRWIQSSTSAAINDHWGIDDVIVQGNLCNTYYYDWFADGTTNSADTSLCINGTSQIYDVIYTDGISDTCSASITITEDFNLTVDLGPDSIRNCDQTTIDLNAIGGGGSGAYNYSWSNGATGSSFQNGLPIGQHWVEIADANAPQCTIRDTITVTDPTMPIADFTFSPVCEEIGITFTDNSTSGDGTLNSFGWDLDSNGTIDATDYPTLDYVFNDDGTFDVVYIVTDDKNCTDTIIQSVEIYPNPEINFTADPLCLGAVTNFTNLTSLPVGTNVSTWAWDFDNSSATSSDENPSYLYQNMGSYDVSLEVTTEDGCIKDTIIPINIAPSTSASFTYSTACEGDTVNFTNTSNGDFENSQWIFMSDSDTLYSTDTSFTFPSYGDYDVALIIEDANGVCSDTVLQTVTVHPLPDLSVTADPMIGTPVMDVNFYSDPSGLISNSWDFANGNSSSELNDTVSNSYYDVGVYNVVHSGYSYEGCFNSYALEIIVEYDDVSYEIPNIITPNNDGINDGFYINFMEASETITEFEIIFLNRWGTVINSFNEPLFIWNGTNNSDKKVSDGVYFYKMKFTTIKGKTHNGHGFVQVVND